MNDKTAIEALEEAMLTICTLCKRLNPQHTGDPKTCDCDDIGFLRKALAALDAEKQTWVIVTDKHELVGGDGAKKYFFDGDNKTDITTKRFQCGKCKRVLHEDVWHEWCPYCGIKLLWPVGKGEENE